MFRRAGAAAAAPATEPAAIAAERGKQGISQGFSALPPTMPEGFARFRTTFRFPFELNRLRGAMRGRVRPQRVAAGRSEARSRRNWRLFEVPRKISTIAVGCTSRRRQSCLAPLASFGATGRLNGWGPAGPHPEGVLDSSSRTPEKHSKIATAPRPAGAGRPTPTLFFSRAVARSGKSAFLLTLPSRPGLRRSRRPGRKSCTSPRIAVVFRRNGRLKASATTLAIAAGPRPPAASCGRRVRSGILSRLAACEQVRRHERFRSRGPRRRKRRPGHL
jgi:hypothetical protein